MTTATKPKPQDKRASGIAPSLASVPAQKVNDDAVVPDDEKTTAPKPVKITGGRLDRIDVKLNAAVNDLNVALEGLRELLAGKDQSKSPIVAELRDVKNELSDPAQRIGDLRRKLADVKTTVSELL